MRLPPWIQTMETDFNSIFSHITVGQEIEIRFTKRSDYDSLRTSLLRRFKNYKPLMAVLDQPDSYIQCTCKKQEDGSFIAKFKMELVEKKSNLAVKKYEVLTKL